MQTTEGRDGDLTSQQWQAVAHLLRTGDPAATAEHVGIADRTLRRWRASEPFRTAMRSAGHDAAREAASRVMSHQHQAVTVLVNAMQAERAPWPVRVAAAGKLLDHGRHVADDDADERLTRLEAKAWPVAVPNVWTA